MTDVIDQLIAQAEAEQHARIEAEEAGKREFLEVVEAAIAEELGELWPRLQPHIRLKGYDVRRGSARCLVDAPDLELAPFYIHYQRGRVTVSWHEYPVPAHDGHVGAFLADCRRTFHERARERHQDRVRDAQARLVYYGARTGDEADAALAELLALEPDKANEWNVLHAKWQTRYDEEQEHAARTAARQALARTYEAEYRAWGDTYRERIELDRTALAGLQSELDTTFRLYKLTYGLVASEDGTSYVDTGYAYVTTDEPDGDGYWLVYQRGALARKRFYHPVSVEGPLASRPTNDPYCVRGQVEIRGPCERLLVDYLYFNPADVSSSQVLDMATLLFKKDDYPEPPEPPAELNQGDVYNIQRGVTIPEEW